MLLLTFIAGANRYAIDVERVVELVPRVELRSVPHGPSYLAGLLGYRGKVVPVIDLGLLMGAAPCRDCLSTRIILVNDGPGAHNQGMDALDDSSENRRRSPSDPVPASNLLGLIGEQVSDLTYVQREQLVPSPIQLLHAPFLDATVQTNQGIVQLIAVERVRDASLRGDLIENPGSEL
jgi:chemotaxis-related protein WspB